MLLMLLATLHDVFDVNTGNYRLGKGFHYFFIIILRHPAVNNYHYNIVNSCWFLVLFC